MNILKQAEQDGENVVMAGPTGLGTTTKIESLGYLSTCPVVLNDCTEVACA